MKINRAKYSIINFHGGLYKLTSNQNTKEAIIEEK